MLSHTFETDIDLPDTVEEINIEKDEESSSIYLPKNINAYEKTRKKALPQDRALSTLWKFRSDSNRPTTEEEKDKNLKMKISTLVQQTLHDTNQKIQSIKHLKEKNREAAAYRAGFVLSMIKKARDVLNELFNVAVKHREQWKALEQLKIFELIVHTNVDTTNLVRQLVELHMQHLQQMNTTGSEVDARRRVVLL